MFFSAQSSVIQLYPEYEGNKEKGSCAGEVIKIHCSVIGSSLTWWIRKTSLTLTWSPIVILFAVEYGRGNGEGAYRIVTTTTNDVHVYQNRTLIDYEDREKSLIESEMHVQLDNENDFFVVTCLDPQQRQRSIKVSVLGMFKIFITRFVL